MPIKVKSLAIVSLFALPLWLGGNASPNVVLLMGDDHGWEETAYNGHPYLHTPVLDEMAASGLRLDRFFSASPVCSPTRGSVITGRHPNRYGTFTPNRSIRPEEMGIAHVVKAAGYRSGHFGKWHLGPVKSESPTNPGAMGFDEWLSHDNFFETDPYLSRNGGPPERFKGESSEILVEETIRFIGAAKQNEKPFLAVVWFGSPHEPYSGLKEDLALYADLPAEYGEESVKLTSMETGLPVRRPFDEVLRERYAEITAMDRAIGRLRDYLAEAGLSENTLVWYCGDNGIPSSGNIDTPFRGQKGNVYDGGIRVPGIIEWPQRIKTPRHSNVITVTSDIFPTLCQLVGLPVPDRPLDGISLLPLIEGELDQRPQPIFFWEYTNPIGEDAEPYIDPALQVGTTPLVKQMNGIFTRNFRNFHHPDITDKDFEGPRAVVDNRYKLVIHEERDGEVSRELFDMILDPAEERDLSKDLPRLAESMEKLLGSWQRSVLNSLTGADYGSVASRERSLHRKP